MAKITLRGNPINTSGNLPEKGSMAPGFLLVKSDLGTMSLDEMKGKRVVLNISPSLDTGVCATALRKFNKEAAGLKNTVVIAITKDLPFAMGRFCSTEGIENAIPLSAFRSAEFGKDYGVELLDGPMAGLLARSVVVLDETGKVIYSELVPETINEPDYVKALAALQ